MRFTRRALLLLLTIGVASCRDPVEPSYPPDVMEYRVAGTVQTATIRYANSSDGLTQVISGLPFSFSIQSTRPTQFLSLDATSAFSGFLQVQIFVNGQVFRDASVVASAPVVSVSGTWRRAEW